MSPSPPSAPVLAVIVAAGRGFRAGGEVPKQYRAVRGRPVLAWALEPFLLHPEVMRVVCAIHPEDADLYANAIAVLPASPKLLPPILGGATRQASVSNALEALSGEADQDEALCLVHDAARMFADAALIDRAIAAGRRVGAALPGLAVTDTIKRVGDDDRIVGTIDRTALRSVQTPQVFRFPALLDAHRRAASDGLDQFTDDGGLADWAGLPVHVFEGDARNMKVTHPADFDEAERRLARAGPVLVSRLATGFDVHVFGPGDHIWLGGVRIPHDKGVVAHSDGDVVLHALTDALLGTLADGDIGTHFPPSDPKWRGASSDQFLQFAAERVREAGGVVDHLDATVLCEAPRVGPHRDAMRERIAAVTGVPLSAVSIKATTTERLGFTGRGEGIAAQAAASVRLPETPR